jgi:DNA-binding IclR family transcriptional regulator
VTHRPSLDALSEIRDGHLTNHADVYGWFDERSWWTVKDLAAATALSRSTVRRYLEDLAEAGYLSRSGMREVVYVRRVDVWGVT